MLHECTKVHVTRLSCCGGAPRACKYSIYRTSRGAHHCYPAAHGVPPPMHDLDIPVPIQSQHPVFAPCQEAAESSGSWPSGCKTPLARRFLLDF